MTLAKILSTASLLSGDCTANPSDLIYSRNLLMSLSSFARSSGLSVPHILSVNSVLLNSQEGIFCIWIGPAVNVGSGAFLMLRFGRIKGFAFDIETLD